MCLSIPGRMQFLSCEMDDLFFPFCAVLLGNAVAVRKDHDPRVLAKIFLQAAFSTRAHDDEIDGAPVFARSKV